MPKPRLSLKGRALRYLSMREHSRSELTMKLNRYADDSDDVSALLDTLEALNFLSTARFSESLVNRRQARFGNQRILAELKSHGVDREQIDNVKLTLVESEAARAIEVLHRKYLSKASDHQERAKQMSFLMQRGFSSKAIQIALRSNRDEDASDADSE